MECTHVAVDVKHQAGVGRLAQKTRYVCASGFSHELGAATHEKGTGDLDVRAKWRKKMTAYL